MSNPFNDPNGQQPSAAPGAPAYPPYPTADPAQPAQPQQYQYPQQPAQPAYPPQQPAYPPQQAYGEPKSKVAAALLAFFLGWLGIHDFYLGYTKAGVAKLAMAILGTITSFVVIGFVLIAVTCIWALVDFICILVGSGRMAHDSKGVPLK